MQCITYEGGYKYQLKVEYHCETGIFPDNLAGTDYVKLATDGKLTIKKGYAWDGPSGPTIDTKTFMRASLVHDALYQLMRHGELSTEKYRDSADRLLQKMCRKDGMFILRAWVAYTALKHFGDPSTDPSSKRELKYAPRKC